MGKGLLIERERAYPKGALFPLKRGKSAANGLMEKWNKGNIRNGKAKRDKGQSVETVIDN